MKLKFFILLAGSLAFAGCNSNRSENNTGDTTLTTNDSSMMDTTNMDTMDTTSDTAGLQRR